MEKIKDIRIVDELKKCIESFDEETRSLFDYYCLGKRKNNDFVETMTLDDYIDIVTKALHRNSNLGHRFVVFKSLTNDHVLVKRIYWKDDSPSNYNRCSENIVKKWCNNSTYAIDCYVTKGHPRGKFVFNFQTLYANCCMVFFIHPSVLSYDADEIIKFASIWDEWFHKIITFYPHPKFRFYFGNKKTIYSGNTPPTHKEIKEHKINVSYDLPVKSIAYEED